MNAGTVTPRPTINLGVSTQRLALALSPAVAPDAFDVDCGPNPLQFCTLHVTGFRTSLASGFAAAFQPFYPLVRDNADLTLRLQTLSIEFDGGQRLIVRYAAQLDDRDGRTLGRSFGTLPVRRLTYPPEATLAEGLTRMFEKVAADCFVPLSIVR